MITVKELDFKLIEDKAKDKEFTFVNDDGSIYDLTDSTVTFKLYLSGPTGTPTEIVGSVTVLTGVVEFSFTTTHTANVGNYEYIIEETKNDASLVQLLKGNVIVESETNFTISIEAFLITELPATIQLEENYIQQRTLWWKLFLQSAAGVSDSNIYNDASWSTLYIMLISKLIAYDALELAGKGSYFQFMGGSYTDQDETPGAPVKSITTGPSEVEFHDTVAALDKLFSSTNGPSAWDTFSTNLCGLANKIGVKLPMCPATDCIFVPSLSKNPDWDYPTLSDLQDEVISVG